MSVTFLDELKQSIEKNLPASSSIIGEVLNTIYDDTSGARDLTRIIERDPILAAEILKVSNSSFYSTSMKIDSIERAIVIVGFDAIKEIATTVSTANLFTKPRRRTSVDNSGLWLHSIGTAKAAQLISKKLRYSNSGATYTIGLLHDIGRILLAILFPRKYQQILYLTSQKKCRIILAERHILKTDHCVIGGILCDYWGLPENITDAICHHHEPTLAKKNNQGHSRLVNLGDYLCRKAGIGNPGDDQIHMPSNAVLYTLGSNPEAIKKMLDTVYGEFLESKEEIEGFYSNVSN